MRISKIWLILILLASFEYTYAEENEHSKIFFSFSLLSHSDNAEFSKLSGIPNCCPLFKEGKSPFSADNFGFGLGYDYHLKLPWNLNFNLTGSISYYEDYTEFISPEKTYVFYNGATTIGEFEHQMEFHLKYLAIFGGIKFFPLSDYYLPGFLQALSIDLGFQVLRVLGATYRQKEEITKPKYGVTFIDENGNDTGSRTRNESEADIPKMQNSLWGLKFGLSSNIALFQSDEWYISPKFSANLYPEGIMSDIKWNRSSYELGISIKYAPEGGYEFKAPEFKDRISDTVHIAASRIRSGDSLLAAPDAKRNYREITFKYDTIKTVSSTIVERRITKKDTVFIENGEQFLSLKTGGYSGAKYSGKINLVEKTAYKTLPVTSYVVLNTDSITPVILSWEYYDMLFKILAKRLFNNESAQIKLKSNYPEYAYFIKEVFNKNYGINSNSIIIDTLSSLKSDIEILGNYAFVKLTSNDDEILSPIIGSDSILMFDRDKIVFEIESNKEIITKTLKLSVKNGNREIKTFEYFDDPPFKINWNVEDVYLNMNEYYGNLEYFMELGDTQSQRFLLEGLLAEGYIEQKSGVGRKNKNLYIKFIYKDLLRLDQTILREIMIDPNKIKKAKKNKIRILKSETDTKEFSSKLLQSDTAGIDINLPFKEP